MTSLPFMGGYVAWSEWGYIHTPSILSGLDMTLLAIAVDILRGTI